MSTTLETSAVQQTRYVPFTVISADKYNLHLVTFSGNPPSISNSKEIPDISNKLFRIRSDQRLVFKDPNDSNKKLLEGNVGVITGSEVIRSVNETLRAHPYSIFTGVQITIEKNQKFKWNNHQGHFFNTSFKVITQRRSIVKTLQLFISSIYNWSEVKPDQGCEVIGIPNAEEISFHE